MKNHQAMAGHQGSPKMEGGESVNAERRVMVEKRGDAVVMAGHRGLPKMGVEVGEGGNANTVEMMVKKRMLMGETMVIPVQCNVSSEWVY
jgi:hypothetical protein